MAEDPTLFRKIIFRHEGCSLPFESVKRKVLIKKEEPTSDRFGGDPLLRNADRLMQFGIVNIDKPSGPTSHQVSAYVRKILGLNKAGHSGTLDPKVTGVLPVALGSATRIVHELLTAGKEYVCLMRLHKDFDQAALRSVFSEMTGSIRQMPPVKSAVKRQWRSRNVYYTKILEMDGRDVLFLIGCEAGTYIRKWVHDLGQKLGGAHMIELRRTKAGPFDESTLCTLQNLTDAVYYLKNNSDDTMIRRVIMPIEAGVAHIPKIWVFDSTVDSLCHGANLNIPGISKLESDIQEGHVVAVMTLKGELVCISVAKDSSENILKKKKGFAAATDRVFMLPGTYPKAPPKKDKNPAAGQAEQKSEQQSGKNLVHDRHKGKLPASQSQYRGDIDRDSSRDFRKSKHTSKQGGKDRSSWKNSGTSSNNPTVKGRAKNRAGTARWGRENDRQSGWRGRR